MRGADANGRVLNPGTIAPFIRDIETSRRAETGKDSDDEMDYHGRTIFIQ